MKHSVEIRPVQERTLVVFLRSVHDTAIYERDLVHGPLPGYHRVCDFLGVAPVAPDVLLTRTNPFRLADILIKYTEIVRHLEATEHA